MPFTRVVLELWRRDKDSSDEEWDMVQAWSGDVMPEDMSRTAREDAAPEVRILPDHPWADEKYVDRHPLTFLLGEQKPRYSDGITVLSYVVLRTLVQDNLPVLHPDAR